MKLYHRYILRGVLLSAFAGIGLFVFVLLSGNAVKEILPELASGRLTLGMFLKLIAMLIPYTVSFALPLGILIGVLVVLGRLSARQEIVAMKAAGISIWHLSAPILLLAVGGVVFAGFVNNFYGPVARGQYRSTLADLVRENPLRFIVPKTFVHDFPGYVIYAESRYETALANLWVWELGEDGQAVRLIRAKRGEFDYDEQSDMLYLTVRNGVVELRDAENPDDLRSLRPDVALEEVRLGLPLEDILGKEKEDEPISEVRLSRVNIQTLLGYRQELKEQLANGTRPVEEIRVDQTRVAYNIQRNFAMAFSILSLTLLGIPLGIQVGRTETYANIGIAIVLAMIFYTLMVVVSWQEDNPAAYPQMLVWLPNFLFQGIGIYMLVRANKN